MMPLVTSIQSIFPVSKDLFDIIYNAEAAYVHHSDVKQLLGTPWNLFVNCIPSYLLEITQENLDEFLLETPYRRKRCDTTNKIIMLTFYNYEY